MSACVAIIGSIASTTRELTTLERKLKGTFYLKRKTLLRRIVDLKRTSCRTEF